MDTESLFSLIVLEYLRVFTRFPQTVRVFFGGMYISCTQTSSFDSYRF